MRAVIFCNGVVESSEFLKSFDYGGYMIICADRGLKYALDLELTPDAIIGDNDSWTDNYPKIAEVIQCPTEKDYTDTQRCIDYALEKGCDEAVILGGLGGRLDHEYSHYCLLAYGLKRGIRITIADKYNEITLADKPFSLKRGDRKYVSFFPFGGNVEGFSVRGLKYKADNVTLFCDEVQASSNEFSEDNDTAFVDFKSGRLLVMLCNDNV